jgi:hypothetical protein
MSPLDLFPAHRLRSLNFGVAVFGGDFRYQFCECGNAISAAKLNAAMSGFDFERIALF